MEYLVMECHLSYAVVMDPEGRFLKVANQNYEVGQRVGRIIPMAQPQGRTLRLGPVLATAACLCLVCVGFWQMMLLSMGTVLIQINPQIRLSVNRMERVIRAEALNADGAAVLFDYDCVGKPVEEVTWELGVRAADMGYLSGGGQVHLQVESENARWKAETERRLEQVQSHLNPDVEVVLEPDTWTPGEAPEPAPSTDPLPTDPAATLHVDRDDDDDDDEDDDDTDGDHDGHQAHSGDEDDDVDDDPDDDSDDDPDDDPEDLDDDD